MQVNLIFGDCLEVLPHIETGAASLCLFDPPYGATRNEWDKPLDWGRLWKQLQRVVKPDGAIVIFCQGQFFVDLVNSRPKGYKWYDLVWDKVLVTGFLNANRMPMRRHEQVVVFYKKAPTYNPQFTEGHPSHSRGRAYKTKDIKNQNYGKYNPPDDSNAGSTRKYPTSIITIQKPHASVAAHATAKPAELMAYLIRTYSNKGETVLDCCMGSGVVGVAALQQCRGYIGIEKNKGYFDIAQERIEKERQKG